jgi:hypothetical protein
MNFVAVILFCGLAFVALAMWVGSCTKEATRDQVIDIDQHES